MKFLLGQLEKIYTPWGLSRTILGPKWCVKEPLQKGPYNIKFIPDKYKTQIMCERAVEDEPETLEFIPD